MPYILVDKSKYTYTSWNIDGSFKEEMSYFKWQESFITKEKVNVQMYLIT
jgi:hypothetical protein